MSATPTAGVLNLITGPFQADVDRVSPTPERLPINERRWIGRAFRVPTPHDTGMAMSVAGVAAYSHEMLQP